MGLLRAGRLDRRIRLERDGLPVHDGYQNLPGGPVLLGEVWAQYLPSPGREKFANAENAATAPVLFRIRWTKVLDPSAADGLNPKDRVRFPATDEGRIYDILSATEIGRREGIEIAAIGRADT